MFAIIVSFIIGYTWGKLVARNGSWIIAGANAIQLVRQVISGIVARLTQTPPSV